MSGYAQLLGSVMNAILAGDTGAAPDLLRPKKDLSVEAQLGVYTEGYRLRLQGALEDTYPALFYYLGAPGFKTLALGFIAANPSRHFNLDKYTIAFGAYVARHSQDAFAADLARLESAIHAVYQAEETTAIKMDFMQALRPEMLDRVLLQPRAASELLAFSFPVDAYFSAFREEKMPQKPAPEKGWFIVLRHLHQVKRLTLAEGEYTLLQVLSEGMPLDRALEDPRMETFIVREDFPAQLAAWFARWATEGILRNPE